jgi:FAD/FMN-containing dehydrogenase/Fe-S oxidoreductase
LSGRRRDQEEVRSGGGEVFDLLRTVMGDRVDRSDRRRAEYSSDASNYRVPPLAVAFPRDTDEVLGALDACRRTGTPLTMRGAGTSVAGNAIGPGVVLDVSRHLTRVVSVDPDRRTAVVEPGAILDDLQAAAAPHGLRFGPDPSTHARCTVGGMIGNNACGAHALRWGRTAENVEALDIVDGTGRRQIVGRGLGGVPELAALVERDQRLLRTELGRFPRQVSGYSLEHLLPEHGGDLAKALVGSEGTCGIVLGATVSLVPVPAATALVVLAYSDMPTAAEAVPALLQHDPLAIEGLDSGLVDVVRHHRGAAAVSDLPTGGGWLLVEVAGQTVDDALDVGRRLAADAGTNGQLVVPGGAGAQALWAIREDGAGLAGRTAAGEPAWPAWEDAAVPVAVLGPYLRDFGRLQAEHGLHGLAYGHFGDGCIHVRLDLPLREHPDRLRPFLQDAAALVAQYGGSLSGEHGDGRARSELLGTMYTPQLLATFEQFKGLFDPDDLLNPGVLVRPRPVDADLRLPAARALPVAGGFALAVDGGDLTTAVHRCVGVGKCRADLRDAGGVMCPSYVATRDETDSTRGRARVLQELANGTLVDGVADPAVERSLDLCLACKACSSDCPAGVDMARYKAEVLHRRYRGRLRPASHYALGWLPRWLSLARRMPRVANAMLGSPFGRAVAGLGGVDARRPLPRLATAAATSPPREERPARAPTRRGSAPRALLWTDTFTRSFDPQITADARRVLLDAGYAVADAPPSCCGLTWITTGQLDGARRRLRGLVDTLHPFVEEGAVVVGLEPSCTAVLRDDLVELLPEDPRASAVAAAMHTLAEALATATAERGWAPPELASAHVVAQPHCHHHAVMGYTTDLALLDAAGADVTRLGGCCGLAGNFGMEQGHHEVSVAVAEGTLLPALRAAPSATLLADGFSCRTQAAHLADRDGVHLATLLARALAPSPTSRPTYRR